MRRLSGLVVLILFLASASSASALTVAAGAGYQRLVTELAQAYEASGHPQVDRIFGNMGQVVSQAKASGLVDVVVGDQGFLEKSGLPFAGFSEIGRGRLVLALAKGVSLKDPAELAQARFTRVAMPDPAKAIYGKAATEFLTATGLLPAVKAKLIQVATVPQVSAYLVSGEVEAGFENLTDAMGIQDKIGGYLLLDESRYAPIRIVGGVLNSAPDAAGAKAFAAFLETRAAREIAKRHGL